MRLTSQIRESTDKRIALVVVNLFLTNLQINSLTNLRPTIGYNIGLRTSF
jgi:hypothetical protein